MSAHIPRGDKQIDSDDDYSEILGGSIGGLHQTDIPRVITNLVEDHGRGIEIRIQPEPLPDDHHYFVEWQYLEFDYGTMTWNPLLARGVDHD